MLYLISWLLFGMLVGYLAKVIHPGDEPVGYLPTIGIGVAGSFVGGSINYLIGNGGQIFQVSGIGMSILGGILCCAAWRYYKLKTATSGPKSFLRGKKIG